MGFRLPQCVTSVIVIRFRLRHAYADNRDRKSLYIKAFQICPVCHGQDCFEIDGDDSEQSDKRIGIK